MISRPAGRCRGGAIETQLAQFQRIDEHIDRPNMIARRAHRIIKAFRQQCRLLAIRPLNETFHHPPAIQQGNHSIGQVFTQSGSKPDLTALKRDFRFSPESRHSHECVPSPPHAKHLDSGPARLG